MIKSTIVATIKRRLGNRTDPGIDDTIDGELDVAQDELEHNGEFFPWFLLSETNTYTTTAEESRVPVPSDMLGEYEEGALFYNGEPLEKHDFDALTAKYYGVSGAPEAYALVNDYFIVFPEPDDAYDLQMKYYAEDALPSATADAGENAWMKHAGQWLLAKAGAAIARYAKDEAAAALFLQDAAAAGARVYKAHVARAEENVTRQMGDD